MKIRVITSFSGDGLERYGKRFMESFKRHWPGDVDLWLYSESDTAPYPRFDLYHDVELLEFLAEAKKRDACFVDDYRRDAGRFAHKVFALTHPRNFENCDWLIWLDGDTETFADVSHDWLKTILPEDASVVYLGRKDMPHSECGFMAFNLKGGRPARNFLKMLRDSYIGGAIWKEDEWHDSWLFDRGREMDGRTGGVWHFHNLSADIPGMHVWDDCPLGTKMKHHKGPLRQQGMTPDQANAPAGYWSQKELAEVNGNVKPGKSNLKVKTKNCVPDDEIQNNIRANVPRISRWVAECRVHNILAVLCSGGPTLKSHIDEIKRKWIEGARIICVKHSHDVLIENGIIPWGCFLLDPRSHVKDFIENPHPDINYFVASMCHPSTVDRLLEKNAKIIGYHAHVGAGEDKVLKEIADGSIMIGGGSTSAIRGVSVLNVLGFRRYHLYGYDSCYWDRAPAKTVEANGLPKWFEAEVGQRRFVTDAELVAQCQDFEKMLKIGRPIFAEMEVFGDGMIPHVFAMQRTIPCDLADIVGNENATPVELHTWH